MKLDTFDHNDWSAYAGGGEWFPLGFTFWASFFTQQPFGYGIDYFATQSIMIWDGSIATSYICSSEQKRFGMLVAKRIQEDPTYVDPLCEGFKKAADTVLALYKKAETESISLEEYVEYQKHFLTTYYPHHVQVKVVVDYLSAELLEKHLPKLQEARIHAEPVFSLEPLFMKTIAKQHAEKAERTQHQLLACTNEEFLAYWEKGISLPPGEELDARFQMSAFIFSKGAIESILVGYEVNKLDDILHKNNRSKEIKGVSVQKGKVQGVARIIIDPIEVEDFNEGDILIAPATRPEYLPIMKRAAAFVTESGGILSHAAIVARELQKPCLTSVMDATRILQDGDMVEVDAEKGIVRKL